MPAAPDRSADGVGLPLRRSDLRGRLASLLAPLAPGEELAPGVRFVHASVELGLRLTFELGGRIVHVEVEPADPSRRFAASTPRLQLSYRTGTGSGGRHVSPQEGKALCVRVAAIVSGNEERVLAEIAADARAAAERSTDARRVRDVEVASLLEPTEWEGTRYYTISPYVGCLIGCRFCYAQSRTGLVRRIESLPAAAWGSYVDVRTNAAEVLAAELATHEVAPIKFCPVVSDPYHAIEAQRGITRACLVALRDAARSFPTMILTRSRLVTRDAELIGSIPSAYAGVSIPTADDEVRRHFEPRAASVAERLAALDELRRAGARTFAIVQPMLPGSIDALADALAARVASVSLDLLTTLEGAEEDFADPRYAPARDPSWQRDRAEALLDALVARGVTPWRGELPPELLRAEAAP